MRQRAQILEYLGEQYHDMNGVTYLHFRAMEGIGDGALVILPNHLFQTQPPFEQGTIVVIEVMER